MYFQFQISGMTKNLISISALLLTLVACESQGNKKDISNTDMVEYSFYPSSVAPQYYRGFRISVTPNTLHLAIHSYGDTLLKKDWSFTKEEFETVKQRVSNLKVEGSIDKSKIPDGGSTKEISLYQSGKKIFSGLDYGSTKNFSGADIDLSYLVPDLNMLVESTKNQ